MTGVAATELRSDPFGRPSQGTFRQEQALIRTPRHPRPHRAYAGTPDASAGQEQSRAGGPPCTTPVKEASTCISRSTLRTSRRRF